MAKVLSSRETLTDTELLKELVEILFDQLGVDDAALDDPTALLGQLEEGVLGLAEKHELVSVAMAALVTDHLQLTLEHNAALMDLAVSVKLLESLHVQPYTEDLMQNAMAILRKEGEAEINLTPDVNSDSGILLETKLTFNEDKLKEALRVAICEYNNSLSAGILEGKIKPA